MKLVFIYGPMSVGKFTTAKALSKLTGYKLFHNHLTVDAVSAIFPEHGLVRGTLLKEMRFMMLNAAAEYNRNTIFTFGYSGPLDNEQVARIVRAVEKHGGEVCFVQLYAPLETLMKRIKGKSRKEMDKPTDPNVMQETLEQRHMLTPVPYPNNLRIANRKLRPNKSAKKIAKHFNLATIR